MKIQSKRGLDFQSYSALNIKSPPEKFVSTTCSPSESVVLLVVQQMHGSMCATFSRGSIYATYCTKFSMPLLNCSGYLLDTMALPMTIRAPAKPLCESDILYM